MKLTITLLLLTVLAISMQETHGYAGMNDAGFNAVENDGTCLAVGLKERVGCGGVGHAKDPAALCRSRGCCYDSSVKKVKWCFLPGKCMVPDDERIACGPATSADECANKGCCYDKKQSSKVNCFRSKQESTLAPITAPPPPQIYHSSGPVYSSTVAPIG